MILIVGLGNPGKKYQKTRHNVGWMVLDVLAEKDNWKKNAKANALHIRKEIKNKEVLLLKPTTFMNNSGISIAYIKKKHPKLNSKDIIIIHDDKDLDFGKLKIQINRGAAGHKGVQSIIERLGTKNFIRIRVGIKADSKNKIPVEKYVLQKFSKKEEEVTKKTIAAAIKAIITILENGIVETMNKFN